MKYEQTIKYVVILCDNYFLQPSCSIQVFFNYTPIIKSMSVGKVIKMHATINSAMQLFAFLFFFLHHIFSIFFF